MRRRTSAVLALAVSACLCPGSALAATVSESGGTIQYVAASGEANTLVVSYDKPSDSYILGDGVAVTPGTGCSQNGTNGASCAAAGITALDVHLDDLADSYGASTAPATTTVDGGAGNDTLNGSLSSDTLNGGAGDDALVGNGGGADTLNGGDDNDTIENGPSTTINAGAGNDTIHAWHPASASNSIDGGDGTDVIDYSQLGTSITIDLVAGTAVTAGAARTDTLAGIENVIGDTFFQNFITGSSGPNVITGGAQADTISGGAGNDSINAGNGADTIDGGADDDSINPGSRPGSGVDAGQTVGDGADVVHGGTGSDTLDYSDRTTSVSIDFTKTTENAGGQLDAGGSNDTLDDADGFEKVKTGSGADTIQIRDSVVDQVVACGAGTDSVTADDSDPVAADCETVSRPTPTGGTGGTGGTGDTGGTGGTGGTTTTSTPVTDTTQTTTSTTTTDTPPTTTPPPTTPAATKCVVPNLIGLTLKRAKKALAKAHCGVGRIGKKKATHKIHGKKPKRGTVIAQSPRPGTRKPAGSKVAVTLAT